MVQRRAHYHNKEVKYSFALDGVNATPSDPTATKFRLIFDANISGNHAEYDTIGEFMHNSTEAVDLPAWTPPTLEDPTVTGVNVLWWNEIYHLMVRYNIDKKDADVDEYGLAIIKSEAVLSNGSDTCSMAEVGGDGDIEVSEDGSDDRRLMDSDTVNVTIYLTYKLGGEEKTKSFTFDNCPINKMAPTLTGAVYSSTQSGSTLDMEDYRIELNKPGGDPHSYNLEFIEVGIIWYTEGGENYAYDKVIWTDGDDNYPFTGDGPYKYKNSDTIDIMPPGPDCTHYSLWFHAIAEGNDEFDTNYPGINLRHETQKWELPDIY